MGQSAVWQPALISLQAIALVVSGAAQSGPETPVAQSQVVLGETFRLATGGVAVVRGEDLRIEFERVLSDSRCPRSTQCITEGDAVIRVWLSKPPGGRAGHDLRTSPPATAEARDREYRIRLVDLEPYPQTDRTTRPSGYVATLLVSR